MLLLSVNTAKSKIMFIALTHFLNVDLFTGDDRIISYRAFTATTVNVS